MSCFFRPVVPDLQIQITVIQDGEKYEIITVKKLELWDVLHLCFITKASVSFKV